LTTCIAGEQGLREEIMKKNWNASLSRLFPASALLCWLVAILFAPFVHAQGAFDPARGIVLHGTVITMNSAGAILQDGSVLVRNGKIEAIWQGRTPPEGAQIGEAVNIDLGENAFIFPGLIKFTQSSYLRRP
jgi:hypothetical protein